MLKINFIFLSKRYGSTSALTNFRFYLNNQIESIKNAGTFKDEKIITSKQSRNIQVFNNSSNRIVNFCSNNYLGLSVINFNFINLDFIYKYKIK
jgi:hypothetical protein